MRPGSQPMGQDLNLHPKALEPFAYLCGDPWIQACHDSSSTGNPREWGWTRTPDRINVHKYSQYVNTKSNMN